ncbi:hypothetical protein [Luteibacter sp. CQ10]|uniref:hypothetical protein n=1 Tax=Luteibacter sp. CQ10 TaxID=2805821 RepID=UPI0034A55FBE
MILKSIVVGSLMSLSALAATGAQAAVSQGSSFVYFDADGNLVGHQITWCESNITHAGNVHTPYQILLTWDCKFHTSSGESIYPGTAVVFSSLPPNVSIPQACAQTNGYCLPGPGPDVMVGKTWTYLPGSGYDERGNPTD